MNTPVLCRSRGNDCFKCVVPIEGDMGLPSLGISPADWARLASSVQIIFHSAANVRFDEPLSAIVKTNVRGLRYLVDLAKSASSDQFIAFVHVSTAFSNCLHPHVEEKFYPPAMDPHKIIEIAEKANADELSVFTQRYYYLCIFCVCNIS